MGRGQLVFKGDDQQAKKKSKKKIKHSSRHDDTTTTTTTATVAEVVSQLSSSTSASIQTVVAASKPPPQQQQQQPAPPQIRNGTGTITVSGTVVTGYDTIFNNELNVGDAIIISVPSSSETASSSNSNSNLNTNTTEMRIITMRLSNISLNISSSFSCNIKYPTSFQYIPKPRNIHKEIASTQAKQNQLLHDIQRHAFDTYVVTTSNTTTSTNDSSSGTEVIYRERTEHGSYRIKSMKYNPTNNNNNNNNNTSAASSNQLSRSELLELRSKKASDKYC